MRKKWITKVGLLICLSLFLSLKMDLRAEEDVRKFSGDTEPLTAIKVEEEVIDRWNVVTSKQERQGGFSEAEEKFLQGGSTYGYQDMEKRSNTEGRQYLYRQMESESRSFTVNEESAGEQIVSGKTYSMVSIIDISDYNMKEAEIIETYFTFRHDNPQYFWLSNTVVYSEESLAIITYDEYKNGDDRKEAFEEILKTIEEVYCSQISVDNSDYHIVLKIHDILIGDIEYSEDVSKSIAHSIAGALTSDRSAVCEGYAKVMQLLMNYYDITNIYVTGTAGGGGHAWNLVRMNDGGYYWLDATWDDQIYEAYQHRYFLVGNNKLVDHVPDGPAGTKTDFLYELPEVSMEDYVYEPIEGVKGDIDQDGNITLKDLLKCLDHVSGNRLLEGNAKYYADMDGNGDVDLKDLLRLLDYVSGAKDVL